MQMVKRSNLWGKKYGIQIMLEAAAVHAIMCFIFSHCERNELTSSCSSGFSEFGSRCIFMSSVKTEFLRVVSAARCRDTPGLLRDLRAQRIMDVVELLFAVLFLHKENEMI